MPRQCRILCCLSLVLFFLLPTRAIAEENLDYIRVSEFIQTHPEQQALMDSFAARVREPAQSASLAGIASARIAIIYPGEQSSDYWRRSIQAFTTRLQKLNIRFELKTFLSRPSVDKQLQAEQLVEALEWQPDYLIFSADALHHRNAIQRLLLRGKPKVILQNITTPIKSWQQYPPLLYSGFDHELGTQLLAREVLDKADGEFALLYFAPGYISRMRGDTFVRAASQNPELTQVASFYTDGNRGKAREATEKIMQRNPQVRLIFSCATDISLGILDALEKLGKQEQVIVNGWGGGQSELEALKQKKLDLTVMRINDDASIAMAEAIRLDLEGNTEQIPQVYSGDIVLLTQSTSEAEIEAYTKQAFRYSDL
ncbi:substrate-binding domain-containing protein [Neptuniibacter halophilus]|uniref:substrate-binding domain-containing protein n=1 Tax=Neptuniibacter halophilus TaxID=651666 RepID=UPI00257418B2|nr:substrate-binding domain-containing protein [Neptuniibacter halophilus]